MEKETEIVVPDGIIRWFQKDATIIIVCLVALLVCTYSLYRVQNYKTDCNDHWRSQWEKSCPVNTKYMIYEKNFTIVPMETQ
ncbi:unnamed protein product, partial [marine sediment metagenome]